MARLEIVIIESNERLQCKKKCSRNSQPLASPISLLSSLGLFHVVAALEGRGDNISEKVGEVRERGAIQYSIEQYTRNFIALMNIITRYTLALSMISILALEDI